MLGSTTSENMACTDEVKVYEDEGEEEEQQKSSENLTEDKVRLVIESETQISRLFDCFGKNGAPSLFKNPFFTDPRLSSYFLPGYPAAIAAAMAAVNAASAHSSASPSCSSTASFSTSSALGSSTAPFLLPPITSHSTADPSDRLMFPPPAPPQYPHMHPGLWSSTTTPSAGSSSSSSSTSGYASSDGSGLIGSQQPQQQHQLHHQQHNGAWFHPSHFNWPSNYYCHRMNAGGVVSNGSTGRTDEMEVDKFGYPINPSNLYDTASYDGKDFSSNLAPHWSRYMKHPFGLMPFYDPFGCSAAAAAVAVAAAAAYSQHQQQPTAVTSSTSIGGGGAGGGLNSSPLMLNGEKAIVESPTPVSTSDWSSLSNAFSRSPWRCADLTRSMNEPSSTERRNSDTVASTGTSPYHSSIKTPSHTSTVISSPSTHTTSTQQSNLYAAACAAAMAAAVASWSGSASPATAAVQPPISANIPQPNTNKSPLVASPSVATRSRHVSGGSLPPPVQSPSAASPSSNLAAAVAVALSPAAAIYQNRRTNSSNNSAAASPYSPSMFAAAAAHMQFLSAAAAAAASLNSTSNSVATTTSNTSTSVTASLSTKAISSASDEMNSFLAKYPASTTTMGIGKTLSSNDAAYMRGQASIMSCKSFSRRRMRRHNSITSLINFTMQPADANEEDRSSEHPLALSKQAKTTHIKKPLNAFMLFMKEMRARVQEECSLKESAAINQVLGKKWHELTREEQTKYYELASREKKLHQQLYPNWSARDNYAYHARKRKRRRQLLRRHNMKFPTHRHHSRSRFMQRIADKICQSEHNSSVQSSPMPSPHRSISPISSSSVILGRRRRPSLPQSNVDEPSFVSSPSRPTQPHSPLKRSLMSTDNQQQPEELQVSVVAVDSESKHEARGYHTPTKPIHSPQSWLSEKHMTTLTGSPLIGTKITPTTNMPIDVPHPDRFNSPDRHLSSVISSSLPAPPPQHLIPPRFAAAAAAMVAASMQQQYHHSMSPSSGTNSNSYESSIRPSHLSFARPTFKGGGHPSLNFLPRPSPSPFGKHLTNRPGVTPSRGGGFGNPGSAFTGPPRNGGQAPPPHLHPFTARADRSDYAPPHRPLSRLDPTPPTHQSTSAAAAVAAAAMAASELTGGSLKKCRARFGLEHQNMWCKPCRRKKKCIRFISDSDVEEFPIIPSTIPNSHPLDPMGLRMAHLAQHSLSNLIDPFCSMRPPHQQHPSSGFSSYGSESTTTRHGAFYASPNNNPSLLQHMRVKNQPYPFNDSFPVPSNSTSLLQGIGQKDRISYPLSTNNGFGKFASHPSRSQSSRGLDLFGIARHHSSEHHPIVWPGSCANPSNPNWTSPPPPRPAHQTAAARSDPPRWLSRSDHDHLPRSPSRPIVTDLSPTKSARRPLSISSPNPVVMKSDYADVSALCRLPASTFEQHPRFSGSPSSKNFKTRVGSSSSPLPSALDLKIPSDSLVRFGVEDFMLHRGGGASAADRNFLNGTEVAAVVAPGCSPTPPRTDQVDNISSRFNSSCSAST